MLDNLPNGLSQKDIDHIYGNKEKMTREEMKQQSWHYIRYSGGKNERKEV